MKKPTDIADARNKPVNVSERFSDFAPHGVLASLMIRYAATPAVSKKIVHLISPGCVWNSIRLYQWGMVQGRPAIVDLSIQFQDPGPEKSSIVVVPLLVYESPADVIHEGAIAAIAFRELNRTEPHVVVLLGNLISESDVADINQCEMHVAYLGESFAAFVRKEMEGPGLKPFAAPVL